MELLVLDTSFKSTFVIDTFNSCIWTDRYNKNGDFEIYTSVDSNVLVNCKKEYYLWSEHSDRNMIVEQIAIDTDIEDGPSLTISGRSLEVILERRIVWGQKILTGNFQDGVEALLNENAINPTNTDRKIPNLIFLRSTDPAITELTVDAQFYGEDLYTAIQSLCESAGVGFKMVLNEQNQFVFTLYVGADRTYDQLVNPYVIFSPNFDNLLNSSYLETNKTLKNVTLVAGEGEGSARKTVSVGTATGLERREVLTEASDISTNTSGGTLTEAQYFEQLVQKGNESLAAAITTMSFDGEIESASSFKHGEDFFIGDIVQIENEYGMTGKARVTEFISVQDTNGTSAYPTFEAV